MTTKEYIEINRCIYELLDEIRPYIVHVRGVGAKLKEDAPVEIKKKYQEFIEFYDSIEPPR